MLCGTTEPRKSRRDDQAKMPFKNSDIKGKVGHQTDIGHSFCCSSLSCNCSLPIFWFFLWSSSSLKYVHFWLSALSVLEPPAPYVCGHVGMRYLENNECKWSCMHTGINLMLRILSQSIVLIVRLEIFKKFNDFCKQEKSNVTCHLCQGSIPIIAIINL